MSPIPSLASSVRRGFTLIELLVVIVIIGILAGGLFMMVNAGSNKSAIAETTTQVHSIAALLEEYKAIYGDYPVVNACYENGGQRTEYAALNFHFITTEGDDVSVNYGSSGMSSGGSIRYKDGNSIRTAHVRQGSGDEMTFGLCSHFVPRATTIIEHASNALKPYYSKQFQTPKTNSPWELEMEGLGKADAMTKVAARETADPNLQQLYRMWRRLAKEGLVEATEYINPDTGTIRYNAGAKPDAWEQGLIYRNSGGAGEILSAGPDGIFGTADDISSAGAGSDDEDD